MDQMIGEDSRSYVFQRVYPRNQTRFRLRLAYPSINLVLTQLTEIENRYRGFFYRSSILLRKRVYTGVLCSDCINLELRGCCCLIFFFSLRIINYCLGYHRNDLIFNHTPWRDIKQMWWLILNLYSFIHLTRLRTPNLLEVTSIVTHSRWYIYVPQPFDCSDWFDIHF